MEELGFTSSVSDGPRRPGRPANSVKTEQLTLSLTPQLREILEELTMSGYFGKTVVETAAALIMQAVEECVPKRMERFREISRMRQERKARERDDKLARIEAILAEGEK